MCKAALRHSDLHIDSPKPVHYSGASAFRLSVYAQTTFCTVCVYGVAWRGVACAGCVRVVAVSYSALPLSPLPYLSLTGQQWPAGTSIVVVLERSRVALQELEVREGEERRIPGDRKRVKRKKGSRCTNGQLGTHIPMQRLCSRAITHHDEGLIKVF